MINGKLWIDNVFLETTKLIMVYVLDCVFFSLISLNSGSCVIMGQL